MQSLLRPGSKPIDTTIIDETRKVTASCSKGLSHGRHGQDNMEIVGAFVDKVLPNRLPCGWYTGFVCFISHLQKEFIYQVLHQQNNLNMNRCCFVIAENGGPSFLLQFTNNVATAESVLLNFYTFKERLFPTLFSLNICNGMAVNHVISGFDT